MYVQIYNDNVEKGLKVLKKKLFNDGRLKEVSEREYFEKPSLKNRRKRKEAINRAKKLIKDPLKRLY